jgi:hypothetical protein
VCTEWCLKCGEITRRHIERVMVVVNKEIEHRVACVASHAFHKLVDEGWDCGIANCDCIERL